VEIKMKARQQLATTLSWLALVVISTAGQGCNLRMAQPGAPAPIAARDGLQPAPEWVVDRLAEAAPDLYFDLGEHDLGAREHEELVRITPALEEITRSLRDLVIVLEGHCDDRGSTELNMRLGGRRAEAVQRVLVGEGFPADQLRTVSLGDTQPQCFARDEACRQRTGACISEPLNDPPAKSHEG